MVFNLLGKRNEEVIQKSIKKYKKVLHDDMHLKVNITYDEKVYPVDLETLKNKDVVFKVPIKNKNTITLKNGQSIKTEFISSKGLFTTKIKITDRIVKNGNTYYTGTVCSKIEKNQRRNNHRLPVSMDVSFAIPPNGLKMYNGLARDISAGGMLIESNHYVSANKKIKVFFELDNRMYRLNATVLRSTENKDYDTYFQHIRFDHNGNKEKNEIAKFIFDEERRELKRRRTGTI